MSILMGKSGLLTVQTTHTGHRLRLNVSGVLIETGHSSDKHIPRVNVTSRYGIVDRAHS
jgi:hypothetical protein